MLSAQTVNAMRVQGRSITMANVGDPALGPLGLLPGVWKNLPNLPGRGWNMIALPFASNPPNGLDYRLLLNQFNEELKFTLVDKAVPNRGIAGNGVANQADQLVVALDYEQTISQLAAVDSPVSGQAGVGGQPIHHEPGLWLHLANQVTDGVDIARLATVPHGDSVLALGTSSESDGPPTIPNISGLPIGVTQDLNTPYLAPYRQFHENPFHNLFDPVTPNALLQAANAGVTIRRTTALSVSTEIATGGIANIPFIVRQANATTMQSTFWIQELDELDAAGNPRLRLQYSQVVFLDFFPRRDGTPGLIRWPHVSINTMEKLVP